MAIPSLVVFGPQTSIPSAQVLASLRAILRHDPRLATFLAAINELPEIWKILQNRDEQLSKVPGAESLQRLADWIACGELSLRPDNTTGILRCALTVIIHIVEYVHYLNDPKFSQGARNHEEVLAQACDGGIQGYCIGLLSAVAVACSKDQESINSLGATALRLAVAIGSYVDLDGDFAEPPNQTCCLLVRWRPEYSKNRGREVLKEFQGAYVSATESDTSAIITIQKSQEQAIAERFAEEKCETKPTPVQGRYHLDSHTEAMEHLLRLCEEDSRFQLPDGSKLLAPVRSSTNGQKITSGDLHSIILKSIMVDTYEWSAILTNSLNALHKDRGPWAVQVGLVNCIAATAARAAGLKVIKLGSVAIAAHPYEEEGYEPPEPMPATASRKVRTRKEYGDKKGSQSTSDASEARSREDSSSASTPTSSAASSPERPATASKADVEDLETPDTSDDEEPSPYPSDAIAIVGMACKYPKAESLEDFWEVLSSATSTVEKMPQDRFSTDSLRRSDKLPFWGNFINAKAFDHKFFKKSAREAASMDPQQRILLEVAYQAMEHAGYFGPTPTQTSDDVGCYIGVATTDYHDNVASHQPNAYSATGTLRAFLSGKISYHFGWTGPSMTIDTACSASMVAIHQACKALQTKECSRALAGGVSVNTSPNMYQNLAAASFLSPTGQNKPFSADGDGYCRTDGCGLLVLKRLSDAVRDGDIVQAVISGSTINQAYNDTGITVPNGRSQTELYQKVTEVAGADPMDVTYVEAHGTGTPVGDPIEMGSIRKVFGSAKRETPLRVGAVKGNIGHAEAASGVSAVIKTILQIHHSTIVPQASHKSLNPKIPALEPDNLAIPLENTPWDVDFKRAVVANYGAAGSNAAVFLAQSPQTSPAQSANRQALSKYPIFISANSVSSVVNFAKVLEGGIRPRASKQQASLADIAYDLATKQNRSFSHAFVTSAAGISDLEGQLSSVATSSTPDSQLINVPKPNPVVLVFGGQTSQFVGLNEEVYKSSVLFRKHLDACDNAIRKAGYKSIFPAIYQTEPVEDIVNLHCMFWAMQYSCAKSWIESGLKVQAMIGHSFGQLTALAASGILSLEDGLKVVAGRATLMQNHWGPESGSMLMLQGDTEKVNGLISSSSEKLEIACYNGPTSHVLVGGEEAITKTEAEAKAAGLKAKKLNVTNGFHSEFTEPLLPHLKNLAGELTFSEPKIHLETCSDGQSWDKIEPQSIVDHTRTPVYFCQAVNRLAERLGNCAWVEAGSGSGSPNMAKAALSSTTGHSFHPVQLSGESAVGSLVDVTTALWKAGQPVQFWPFHRSQKDEYHHFYLPPYQFEKTEHWLDWVDIQSAPEAAAPEEPEKPEEPTGPVQLLSFLGFRDETQREAQFLVDQRAEEFTTYVRGHSVLAEPLCPAPFYVELVSRGAQQLSRKNADDKLWPDVENLECVAPLGLNNREITILLKRLHGSEAEIAWEFYISSQPKQVVGFDTTGIQHHATGVIMMKRAAAGATGDFGRYERLIGYRRCEAIMADPDTEIIRGRHIYKAFAKVVNYAPFYKGVRSVYAKDNEIVGRVKLPEEGHDQVRDTEIRPLAIDNFIQTAGLHVNCIEEVVDGQVYICTKIDRIQIHHDFKQVAESNPTWTVYSMLHPVSNRDIVNDIFVFDTESKHLLVIIYGAKFTRIPMKSLVKSLIRANDGESMSKELKQEIKSAVKIASATNTKKELMPEKKPNAAPKQKEASGVLDEVRAIIAKTADIDEATIKADSTLEGLGIDSLMITEVVGDIQKAFELAPTDEFQNLPDVGAVGQYIEVHKGITPASIDSLTPASSDSGSSSPSSMASSVDSGVSSITSVSSVTATPDAEDNLDSELAKLVQTHLECETEMTANVNLSEAGFDSLLGMELTTDIKKMFSIDVDLNDLTEESTFGDMLAIVRAQKPATGSKTPAAAVKAPAATQPKEQFRQSDVKFETVEFKKVGNLSLCADVYYAENSSNTAPRPLAIMIHGGGHTMLSRKDIRPPQTKKLLEHGFLPISIDYRLCPEINIRDGPMTDVCDAIEWARNTLPTLSLEKCPKQNIDTSRTIVIGWSTGGTLAMTSAWTTKLRGMEPPNAILAFYCPTNYEDPHWVNPNYPEDSEAEATSGKEYDLLDAVNDEPILAYNVPKGKAVGGWMSLEDPRSRIVLHMNWRGQALPVLLGGLPSTANKAAQGDDGKDYYNLPIPPKEDIISISPWSQIKKGAYTTPTYLIHGTLDDLIPWQQSVDTSDALKEKGIDTGVSIVEDKVHLFDLYRTSGETGKKAVEEGYKFLFEHV